jgi:hypothetical protein
MNKETPLLTMSLKDWGLKDIVQILEQIKNLAPLYPPLAAHLEHEMWGDVLRKTVKGHDFVSEMAALALTSLEISFKREKSQAGHEEHEQWAEALRMIARSSKKRRQIAEDALKTLRLSFERGPGNGANK